LPKVEQERIFEGPVWNYLCLERPISRAGITFVLLKTSRSPGRSSAGKSRICRSSSSPEAGMTSSRAAVARLARVLRDPLARQVEIEIVDVHSLTAGDGAPTRLSSIERLSGAIFAISR